MKKAKVILAVIGLLAVAGGALAVKASRGIGYYFAATGTTTINGSVYQLCQPLKNYISDPGAPTRLVYTSVTFLGGRTVCTGTPFTVRVTVVAIQ